VVVHALDSAVELENVARQRQVEGGTAVARRRSAMSQAARAGSQVAQWTTPSRARQNVIPSQRQHGLRSFTADFVMAFSPRVMPPPTRGHHCSDAACDGKSLKP
jgi:hypothetical protein